MGDGVDGSQGRWLREPHEFKRVVRQVDAGVLGAVGHRDGFRSGKGVQRHLQKVLELISTYCTLSQL